MPLPGEDPEWLLPFEYLQPGESFFIPTLKPAEMHYVLTSRAASAKVKVKIYTTTKDGCMGVRVWRIAV